MLRLYLFVNAYTQENHDGILHEAFDHGTNVEKLENHGDLHNAVHPEQDDYTAYSLDMHNMHEVHDGTNFLMEDHPEEHPAWNFMEDSAGNKVVEEGNPVSNSIKSPGLNKPSNPGGSGFRAVNRGPVQSRSRAGCTSNVPQAQLLANTIIGMISQSNQMMGQLVRMFQIQVVPQPNMMGPFGGNPNLFGQNVFSRPNGNPFGNPFGPSSGNSPFGPGSFGPNQSNNPFGQNPSTGPFGRPGVSPGQGFPTSSFPQNRNPSPFGNPMSSTPMGSPQTSAAVGGFGQPTNPMSGSHY